MVRTPVMTSASVMYMATPQANLFSIFVNRIKKAIAQSYSVSPRIQMSSTRFCFIFDYLNFELCPQVLSWHAVEEEVFDSISEYKD